MRSNTIRWAWVDLLSKSKHVKISLAVGAYTMAQFMCTILCSAYYIASESNQVCLWLPYVSQSLDYLLFPILLRAARQWAWWRDDVCSCSDVYRYYFCTNCTNTQCLLQQPALKGEGRFARWVILIGCAKTDEPITGNITRSFCIFLLANPAWPSYVVLHDRLAIKTQNKGYYAVQDHSRSSGLVQSESSYATSY